jgi:endothelin-converting enzyme/putative endopeptidase
MKQDANMRQGFDASAIDKNVDPCTDFYQYACGNWLASNPIPPDQSSWGRFSVLAERNRSILKDILETSAAKTNRAPFEQKIGDYYTACMDEKGIEAKGITPLQPELKRIAALSSKADITAELIRLHLIGASAMFHFSSGEDFKDSTMTIAEADQGGLSLPERDYYFRDDPKSVDIRNKFVAHVEKMFMLRGDSQTDAAAKAKAVMAIETSLAKGALDRVARRDPANNYHKLPLADLKALAPSINWDSYLTGLGISNLKTLNIVVPGFFKQLEATIQATSLEDWKTYLDWHYFSVSVSMLPSAFVNENFNFFGKTLSGQQELRARWKRCVAAADSDLPEALGRKYVELTFGAEGKQRTLELVHNLTKAMAQDIRALDWMTPETKKKAEEKLQAISNKIGYPEKWKDYATLKIDKNDALGNSLRSNEYQLRERIEKIGKPVDTKEWFMSPPTVNAYYNPLQNNINFPAGILQPPFFETKMDDAVNYGAIGAVIGHEMTHGFDDQGRQFDAKGNLADWWTEQDAKEFKKRADCIEKEYSSFIAVDDLHVNGKLTLGENVADNGGLRIAYMALMNDIGKRTLPKIDGYTPEQRFFLGFGQIWCQRITDASTRLRTQTDPHSPAKYRVNGTVSNMPEFQKAFSCKAGQPMVRADACHVW